MYKIILAIRYLLKRRISYFAVLAVALCVFIVFVVMTVMTGLVRDFRQKNHRFTGDCIVSTESLVGFTHYEDFMEKLEEQEFVEGVSSVIKSYALVTPEGMDDNYGLEMTGIDPALHSIATGFGQSLHHRKDDVAKAFAPVYDPNLPGFVVGIDRWLMRDSEGKYPYHSRPDKRALAVTCFPLTAKGALAKVGAGLVNTKTFYFSDTSHSGLARVDSSMIYLSFDEAQMLCGMGEPVKRANAIHIKFKPGVKLETGCGRVASLWRSFKQEKADEKYADLLEKVTVQSWKNNRRVFIAAMEKEQTMMTAMFVLVGITTVFIVFVVSYMIISHKSKDIGILKSIGVSNANVMLLFFGFAFLVGFSGSVIGTVGGWRFLVHINGIEKWLYDKFEYQPLWDRTIFAIDEIPNTIDFKVLCIIILSAIAACLAGALLPCRQAAKQKPIETLQVSQL
jgi:lipoprotein-releasing system permease protein